MGLSLVLGGIRSGKSEHAERLAHGCATPVVYVATGVVGDAEMAERIVAHRARRPPGWRTIECPDLLAALGPGLAGAGQDTLLIDGLGGWLCHLMEINGLFTEQPVAAWGSQGEAGRQQVLSAVAGFAAAAAARPATTVVVADETGMGGVPAGAGSRRFHDLSGEAAQILAAAADAVWLVVAGQAVALKPPPRQGRMSPDPAAVSRDEAGLRAHGDSQVPPGHLDFAVNVVPGGPPPEVREAIAAALGRGGGAYPDDAAATAALARHHGRPCDEVLVLNGAAEAFWLLAAALRPSRPVCVHPSFTEPEAALRAHANPPGRVFRDPEDYRLDPARVDLAADFVVTGNPNNPTGTLDPAAELETLAHPGRVLVVDEAFMDFVPGEAESLAGRRDLPGLVVVRSLTKLWCLPGLRAGYLVGPPEVVAALRAARQPWAVNVGALAALQAYATAGTPGGPPGPGPGAAAVVEARDLLAGGLRRLPGVRVWPSVANFLLMQVPDGPTVRAGLAERRIAVRRGDTFPGLSADHLRVAVRSREDNDLLVAALGAVLAKGRAGTPA